MQKQSIENILKEHDNYVICGHVNPDFDCIGSQVALSLTLKAIGKKTTMLLGSELDPTLTFLPDTDKFSDKAPSGKYCFICVDLAQDKRLAVKDIKEHADYTITIDHHQKEEANSEFMYVDSTAPSASYIVWNIAKKLNVANKDIATACLCGLFGDTGSFRFQNTDERAFEAAHEMVSCGAVPYIIATNLYQKRRLESLDVEKVTLQNMIINKEHRFAISYLDPECFEKYGATKADTEGMVDLLRSLDCVDVVCLLRQVKAGEKVHGSLRSKIDIDISVLAAKHNGGGHKAAAGFTMDITDLNSAIKIIEADLINLMS